MLIENSPTSLDPRVGVDAQSQHIYSLIFDSLVRKDTHFNLQPWIATSWETPDLLTYRFHLRTGVLFHNGQPLTAADVKYTIDTMRNGTVITAKAGALVVDDKAQLAGLSEAEQSAGEIASFAANWIPSLLRSVWSDSQALFSAFSLLIVTPIVTFYLLKDWNRLIATIDRSIPLAQRDTVQELANELDDTISGFLRGQGTICLILAVYYALALYLIGLNHGILIGLFAGLISFIPYLGSFAGLLLSVCVAVLQLWPSWTMIPVVLAIFLSGQAIADYVLAPYLVASRIHLNPVWVMFAIAAFGYLFGFVGLLLAVPLAAAVGVLVRFALRQLPAGSFDTSS